MKWLYRLEYKFGNRYIRNLMTVIVAGMAGVYVLDMFFSAGGIRVSSWLDLNTAAILHGQVWRLVTFLFVYPSNSSPFFILFSLYLYYAIGRSLEQHWGGFKLNAYYLCGIVGAILAAFLTHCIFVAIVGYAPPIAIGTNSYLNTSLFLAFASIAPDAQFLLFFILPIKARWFLIGYAAITAFQLLRTFLFSGFWAGLFLLITLLFSLVNYALFFGPALLRDAGEQLRLARNRRHWRNQNRR